MQRTLVTLADAEVQQSRLQQVEAEFATLCDQRQESRNSSPTWSRPCRVANLLWWNGWSCKR